MLASLNDVLPAAKKNKYAVGMFNTVSLEMAKAILEAAEETRSPVIIGTAEVLLPYAALDELAYFLLPMAKKAAVPVVVHMDHGLTDEVIFKAIELGFTSIMMDRSTLPFRENLEAVRVMTAYAHSRGVSVEAELGHVGAASEEAAEARGEKAGGGAFTDPDEAQIFAALTGVDALAIAFGSAHGAYRSAPKLNFGLVEEIAGRVSAPLVLHGGSGLTDGDFRTAIAKGIAKVNIFTDINATAAKGAFDNYRPGAGATDLTLPVIEAMKAAAVRKMKVFGCCGKAG
ncbi:MAG: class II fructose-bisphosphate aldolase [Firmicutes bacterium]|nr:class II fructose-bisphosphate aldolase [Bacillota bacterium]